MRELWAKTMYDRVYSVSEPETTTAPVPEVMTVAGDANLDGTVELADAIFVMQSLAQPNKYELKIQGRINADVDGQKDGVTSNDALTIQLYLLHRITELPYRPQ